MTRDELIAELERLIAATKGRHETAPAAAVLSCLVGALLLRSDVALMDIAAQFSREQIQAAHARGN